MIQIAVDVGLGHLDKIAARLEAELQDAVDRTSFYGVQQAQIRAPIDTGAYKNSIARAGNSYNEFLSAMAVARSMRPAASFSMPGFVPRRFESIIGPTVDYAIFVEYGAFHRRGNTKRLGNRSGRIGVEEGGGFATYQAGYLVMTDTAELCRAFLSEQVRVAIRRSRK